MIIFVFKIFQLSLLIGLWNSAMTYRASKQVIKHRQTSLALYKLQYSTIGIDPVKYSTLSQVRNISSIAAKDLPASLNGDIPWEFHLLEKKDLSEACSLSVDAFHKPPFIIDSTNASPIEVMLLNGFSDISSRFDRLDSWLSCYIGYKSRGGRRLSNPRLTPSEESVIIVATVKTSFRQAMKRQQQQQQQQAQGQQHPTNSNNHRKTTNSYSYSYSIFPNIFPWSNRGQQQQSQQQLQRPSSSSSSSEIVAIVELSLEPPNGLLSDPLKSPLHAYQFNLIRYQPYLSNLCVLPRYRRYGLGKILCNICEHIAIHHWLKHEMYLHMEKDNLGAQKLYESMGYEEKTHKILTPTQIKQQKMERIAYYYKRLVPLEAPTSQSFCP